MTRSSILLVLLCLLSFSARAEFLIGPSSVNSVIGPTFEWAGQRSSYYAVVGAHMARGGWDVEDDMRWVIGSRHRLDRGTTDTSGFYVGALAGDLGGRRQYERLGIGGEIGHQWVGEFLRLTVSSGLAILEEQEERDNDYEPMIVMGISLMIRRP